MCASWFFSHLVAPQARFCAPPLKFRINWRYYEKINTIHSRRFCVLKPFSGHSSLPIRAPRSTRMHSWTKSVYLQTNELFFNRRSLLLHHVVEKPLDEKWNEKAWWNKMHHVSIFARSVAGVDVPPVPERNLHAKNEFYKFTYFPLFQSLQHISYLYIYVSIECFLILKVHFHMKIMRPHSQPAGRGMGEKSC